MKSLEEYFRNNKGKLISKLQCTKDASEAISIIQEEIDNIEDKSGIYIGSLSYPQSQVAYLMLKFLRNSLKIPISIYTNNNPEISPKECERRSTSSKEYETDRAEGDMRRSKIGQIMNDISSTSSAVSDAVTEAVYETFGGRYQEKNIKKVPIRDKYSEITKNLNYYINIDRTVSAIESTFCIIDDAVIQYGKTSNNEKKEKIEFDIEDQCRLLEFLQNILSLDKSNNDQLSNNIGVYIKELHSLLKIYDIRVIYYQPEQIGTDRDLFEFEPSINDEISEFITLMPALIRDGKVLLRGRVIEPNIFK
jgi:hypothetical protein